MTYRTPEDRRERVDEVLEALGKARRVILTTHVNADGDGTGCQIALASWLRGLGREAWIINPTPFPDLFEFLLPDEDWIVHAGSDQAAELARTADLGIVVDTGELSRLGRVKPLFDGLPTTIVVDHHPPGEDAIPGISFREPSAAAAGELVYDVLRASGEPLSADARDAIYVAIMTDTGTFRFSNATPGAFRIAAELVEAGTRPDVLHQHIYGSHPLHRLELLRDSLAELEVDDDGLVAWMSVPPKSFERLGATAGDLDGFVDYPRSVEGVEAGLLFRSLADGSTKVSFRSTGRLDVNVLARRFGGGGHVKAAGAKIRSPMEEARRDVVEAAVAEAKKIRNPSAASGVE